jgi:serine/threonine protein phosphatase PrpC
VASIRSRDRLPYWLGRPYIGDMTNAGEMLNQAAGRTDHVRSVLRVCGATDIGLEREQNQDTFVIADLSSGEVSSPCVEVGVSLPESGYLLLVCDGMGGAAAGEVAARIAAGSIRKTLVAAGGDTVSAHPGEALDDAVTRANRAILKDVQTQPQRRGMGTTCTAAIVLPGTLTIAQVGDSRAYLLRDGKLSSLTKDQSLAVQLLEQGVLTPEQMSSFRHRNVLMQALGTQTAVEPVISQIQLSPGDRVLLCSDGLHGIISEADIQAALGDKKGDLTSITKTLVDRALAAGGDDNVTVVVAEYRSPELGR